MDQGPQAGRGTPSSPKKETSATVERGLPADAGSNPASCGALARCTQPRCVLVTADLARNSNSATQRETHQFRHIPHGEEELDEDNSNGMDADDLELSDEDPGSVKLDSKHLRLLDRLNKASPVNHSLVLSDASPPHDSSAAYGRSSPPPLSDDADNRNTASDETPKALHDDSDFSHMGSHIEK